MIRPVVRLLGVGVAMVAAVWGCAACSSGGGGGEDSGAGTDTVVQGDGTGLGADATPGADARPASDVSTGGDAVHDATAHDAGPGVEACVPTIPEGLVAVDLSPYLAAPSAKGAAYARKIEDASDLVEGEAEGGRVGDWAIGTDAARWVIRGPARVIGPCPWGGIPVDGDIVRPDGEPSHEVVGAVCLFFNIGRTLKAERMDVLSDGSNGCPAILAATGPDTVDDFINALGMVKGLLGLDLDLLLNPDVDGDLLITTYYIAAPGSRALRMVTAVRNDGADPFVFSGGDLIDSGGSVEFFNPASSLKGFGYSGLVPEVMDFMAFRGARASYAYVPPQLDIDGDGKPQISTAYLAIAGVVADILGTDDALGLLTAQAGDPLPPGIVELMPGDVQVFDRWLVVGDASLSSLTDVIYELRGVDTGTVSGQVSDDSGQPVAGVRVSAVDGDGTAWTQATTAEDGTFSMHLPPGEYDLEAYAEGRAQKGTSHVVVEAGKVVDATVTVTAVAGLRVVVTDPSGQPLVAKVTAYCEGGTCPDAPTSQVRDVTFDWHDGMYFHFTDPQGVLEWGLPPGDYRIVVSHGPEWSLWPADSRGDTFDFAEPPGGAVVHLQAGKTVELQAVLYHAVDTTGWVSGDFHVHAVNSPDSPVSLENRVITFAGEGVDVLVGTDHDYITDYRPIVEELKLDGVLAAIPGEELTTFDYGHYNAFPLVADLDSPNGGAVDWGGGEGYNLTPGEIFEALRAFPGEQVVQVNHGFGGSGYFGAMKMNAFTGITLVDPTVYRMPPTTPDPETGDTHLWDDTFTAMEIYNGLQVAKFYKLFNWWLAFHDRGLHKTGTAVSDTHRMFTSQGGGPRSFVYVGDADSVSPLDTHAFVAAINAGRVVGSNGPFVEFELVDEASGEQAALGDTLSVPAGTELTLRVTVQTPAWFRVDRVRIYSNTMGTTKDDEGWQPLTSLVEPQVDVTLDWSPQDLEPGEDATPYTGRWRKVVDIPWTATEDAWFIALVTGEDTGNLLPLNDEPGVWPLAFTNAILLDVGGDGWTPPVDPTQLANNPPPAPSMPPSVRTRILTRSQAADLLRQIRERTHDHGRPIHY